MVTDTFPDDRTPIPTTRAPVPAPTPARRYDLDWLRVFAFGMLIFYHVGMFYVTWDWHVKSRYMSDVIEPAMVMVNPWRLALLFFISGVAIRFATDKTTLRKFLPERLVRLFVPLAFGMAVVCMPQAYAELRFKGEIAPGFFAFYPDYLTFGDFSIIVPTWNHLWYVAYMLAYTLIAAALLPGLRRVAAGTGGRFFAWLEAGRAWRLLLAPALPFVAYRLTLDPYFPTTHTLWGDWANIAHTLTIFLLGFVAAKNASFWNAVAKALPSALAMSLALGGTLLVLRLNFYNVFLADESARMAVGVLRVAYAWAIIVSLLGLAQAFANRGGRVLTYLTGAIFPYYILHQTIIVVVGYWFTLHVAPTTVEAPVVIAATVIGCVLGYEVIRRIPLIRPLFGLPMRDRANKAVPLLPGLRRVEA